MRRLKKSFFWGFFVIIICLMAFFGFLIGQEKRNKENQKVAEKQVGGEQENVIEIDNKKYLQKKQTIWQVVDWDFKRGELKVNKDGEESQTIKVDLNSMRILIPHKERKLRGSMMGLSVKNRFA